MNPIPNVLLGDEITLEKPTESGWTDTRISNVRAEKVSAIEDNYNIPQEKTELFVWYDCVNSYPNTDFEAGMRIKFRGEVFEIVKVREYKAKTPHHIKITADKIKVEEE